MLIAPRYMVFYFVYLVSDPLCTVEFSFEGS